MADEAVVIHQSRAKAAIGVALAAAMLAAGLWLVFQGEPQSAKGAIARYVATPIFAVLTLIGLKTLLLPSTLVLARAGVELKQVPGGFRLGWDQVANAQVVNPWFVEKVVIATPDPKRKKTLPAAWTLPPKQVAEAVLQARARWEGQGPAPNDQPALVS